MYLPILLLHSYLRWLVIAMVLTVGLRSWTAWRRGLPWDESHEHQQVGLLAAVDIQLSLGLWLYFSLSPLPHVFWDNVHAGLTRPVVRFFGIEHITGMLSAIVLLHIGRVWSRRATSDSQRHRRVWIATLAAALIVLISIPWPWMKYGRPLLRLPG